MTTEPEDFWTTYNALIAAKDAIVEAARSPSGHVPLSLWDALQVAHMRHDYANASRSLAMTRAGESRLPSPAPLSA